MYCRKCLKEGKKINMDIDSEEGFYRCKECGNMVYWSNDEDENQNGTGIR